MCAHRKGKEKKELAMLTTSVHVVEVSAHVTKQLQRSPFVCVYVCACMCASPHTPLPLRYAGIKYMCSSSPKQIMGLHLK